MNYVTLGKMDGYLDEKYKYITLKGDAPVIRDAEVRERLKYYIKNITPVTVVLDEAFIKKNKSKMYPLKQNYHSDYYCKDLDIMKRYITRNFLYFICKGDNKYDCVPYPFLTKTICIAPPVRRRNCRATLLPLQTARHWKIMTSVNTYDIPFAAKMKRLIWRGATTGTCVGSDDNKNGKASRIELVEKYYNKFDIGFSSIVQNRERYRQYLKNKLSIPDLLKHKYLIVVEGNDKASCLQWVLYSNSVPIMPKPYIRSWLMEDKLVPWKHYVPLKSDFSDLEDKYQWCLDNDEKCKTIANNGKNYIRQFLNPDIEKYLIKNVLESYGKNVKFVNKSKILLNYDNVTNK